MTPIRKQHLILKMMNKSLIDLPAPLNISYWWNYGSMLGLFFLFQFVTGILLACHYTPHIMEAFNSMVHIIREVNWGWLLHTSHMNGASYFFLLMYIHMARGIYYSSFFHKETWNLGVMIFILTMATAFLGYVLPWGQMSFWGATVITNIFSAIPLFGPSIVEWIWGGFAVSDPTLHRFFTMHYLCPFIIAILVMGHFMFLHKEGSNNPLGINIHLSRIPFHPYFSYKDMMGFLIITFMFISTLFFFPNALADPENYLEANPLTTPTHIQPEWYFLWLYAILRSIPNKLGGVVALLAAIFMLFLPTTNKKIIKVSSFNIFMQLMFWVMVMSWLILTWIGSKPVEYPYISLGQISTFIYFSYFLCMNLFMEKWNNMMI